MAGMEGHGDHGLHLAQVYHNGPIVIGHIPRVHFLIGFRPLMLRQVLAHHPIRTPDGAQAGGFRGHYVDAIAKIHGKPGNPRSHKFQYLVFHKAFFVNGFFNGKGHVLGTDAVPGCSL